MNFDLDENGLMVRDMVRRFAEDRLGPDAQGWTDAGALPSELFTQLGELGLTGLIAPEDAGGAGFDLLSAALAVEELARHDGSTAVALALHTAPCSELLARAKAFDALEPLIAGASVGAWVDGAGSVCAGRDGDDWTLGGEALGANGVTFAGLYVVRAETDEGEAIFTVAPEAVTLETTSLDPAGLRAAPAARLRFDGSVATRLEVEEADIGAALAMGRVLVAAALVGLGRGALVEGLSYANEREQFGKALARFQATQFKLADMALRVDAARLSAHAAALADEDGRVEASAKALLTAADAALYATDEALQIHGGYGYTREYPVQRMYQDAVAAASALGTRDEARRLITAEWDRAS